METHDRENSLTGGTLECCKAHDFDVFVGREIKHGIFAKMFFDSDDGDITMEVHCKTCGKVIPLFDSRTDGYENCSNYASAPLSLSAAECQK